MAGCGSAGRIPGTQGTPQAASGLQQLPFELPPTDEYPDFRHSQSKQTSSSQFINVLLGNQWLDKSDGANPSGITLRIISDPGELEWAVYALPVADFQFEAITADLYLNEGNGWAAISDYSRNTWEISPISPDPPYYISNPTHPERYVSASGWVYFAVLSYDASDVYAEEIDAHMAKPDRTDIALEQIGVNGHFAMTEYDGKPLLAVVNADLNRVECWRASVPNPQALGDFSVHELASYDPSVVLLRCDVAVVGGRPAIAWGTMDQGVHYAAALVDEPAGAADWAQTQIDTVVSGNQPDVEEQDGKPMVVFTEVGGFQRTLFAYSDLAVPLNDDDWDRYQIKVETGDQDYGSSLLIFDGRPNILVHDSRPDHIDYWLFEGKQAVPSNIFDWDSFRLSASIDSATYRASGLRKSPWAILEGKPAFLFPAYQQDGGQSSYILGQFLKSDPAENSDLSYGLFDENQLPAVQSDQSRPADLKVFNDIPYAVTSTKLDWMDTNIRLTVWHGVAPWARDETEFIRDEIGQGEYGYGQDAQLHIADHQLALFYFDRDYPDGGTLHLVFDNPL